MSFDNSLFEHDAGYSEYVPGFWLPTKPLPNDPAQITPKAIDAALSVDLDVSDILIATYPKTGRGTP